jgi:hypothetical protein
MKRYVVIKSFTDLKDNNYKYSVGDEYPHTGYVASDERIKELSSKSNRRGIELIELEDIPENTSPLTEEIPLDVETDENPVEETEAKRKPRKSHARTDS